ncbi:Succinylglutamate desuccinylase (plasmid) [Raoultella ornithinolytica]|uniref:succinylglutamate desuccinylase n=1 Tax=Raoultella ornithinolytica TaxID=54291 RepID=UPI0007229057|nr:succinylglutamate desuccinylase [Raoultella ornithinolytica]ALQ49766.1 Succinylglutamate desuccinylase [Raoultella ornithinolytica]
MNFFLEDTLRSTIPQLQRGERQNLHWRWLGEGIMELTPTTGYRESVVISAGIHGNETAPIELLDLILSDLLSGKLALRVRLLVILGNPPAMRAGKRYLSTDMNRMFSGRHKDFTPSYETERTRKLEAVMTAFWSTSSSVKGASRFHYDLHTAIKGSHLPRFGLLPFQNRPYHRELLKRLEAADLDALVMHQETGNTFSHFSSEQFLAESCTLELGKANPFGENKLSDFRAIDRVLRAHLGGLPFPHRSLPPVRLFRVDRTLVKHTDDFELGVPSETLNFTQFEKGAVLCRENGSEQRVENDQEWMLFPNPGVQTGMRAGLMLTELNRWVHSSP